MLEPAGTPRGSRLTHSRTRAQGRGQWPVKRSRALRQVPANGPILVVLLGSPPGCLGRWMQLRIAGIRRRRMHFGIDTGWRAQDSIERANLSRAARPVGPRGLAFRRDNVRMGLVIRRAIGGAQRPMAARSGPGEWPGRWAALERPPHRRPPSIRHGVERFYSHAGLNEYHAAEVPCEISSPRGSKTCGTVSAKNAPSAASAAAR